MTELTKVDTDQTDIFSVPRDWLFASGETVNAVVSGVDDNLVVLKEIPEGEERSLPIAELTTADRILLSDQLQFRESPYAGDHSSLAGFNLSGNSEITPNDLKRAHETYTLSPYAGLCYAFYLCELTDNYNDYKAARNILRTVTERIDRQREYDPDRHSVTLSSVHNNMAICFVREHNFVAAVASLKASLDASPDNTAARRNAYAIKVLDGQLQNRAKPLLSSSPRIVLEGLVGTFAPAMPITAWTHTFDVEQPGPLLEKNKSFSSTHGYDWSRLSAPSTWCVPCEGRGFFACPSCGGDGQVSGRERSQAGVDPIYGPIQTIRPTVGRCANCSGIGRFDCKDCERGRLRP